MNEKRVTTGVLFGSLVYLNPSLDNTDVKALKFGVQLHISPSLYAELNAMQGRDALERAERIEVVIMDPSYTAVTSVDTGLSMATLPAGTEIKMLAGLIPANKK